MAKFVESSAKHSESNTGKAGVDAGLSDAGTSRGHGGVAGKSRYVVFAVVAVAVILADQLTKLWAMASVPKGGMDFIPGLIGFKMVYNSGASFGMMEGAQMLFVAMSVAICIAILVYLYKYKRHTYFETVALSFIFAGAVGNAIDRVFRGIVTDFLNFEFFDFPVFNVADCGVTIGVVIWMIFIIFSKNSPFASERAAASERAVESDNPNADGKASTSTSDKSGGDSHAV